MNNDNLGSLFQPDPSAPAAMALRQGVVEAWDSDTGENSIQVAGGVLVNIPSLTAEAAELVAGDVVALLTSGDRALVIGKVTTPGDPGTVPSWNADITALAPLTNLAAVTTGLTIMGATNITTDPGDGAHVVINDPAYPGQIALYSGNLNELTPALIRPILGAANYGLLELYGPILDVSGQPAYLDLEGYDDGHSTANLNASGVNITADNSVDVFGFGTGARIGSDSAAGEHVVIVHNQITDADLSSLTNDFPTFPYYNAYLNASVAITTSGVAQKITGWVADGSPNNSGITYSAGNFTIPTTGRYRLRAQAWWALVAGPVGFRTVQWIRVSPNTGLVSNTRPGSATSATPCYAEKTVRLSAGEEVFVQVVQTQANGHQLIGSNPDITYAQIEWVGP